MDGVNSIDFDIDTVDCLGEEEFVSNEPAVFAIRPPWLGVFRYKYSRSAMAAALLVTGAEPP